MSEAGKLIGGDRLENTGYAEMSTGQFILWNISF